jgi:hypothetical protein
VGVDHRDFRPWAVRRKSVTRISDWKSSDTASHRSRLHIDLVGAAVKRSAVKVRHEDGEMKVVQ